MKKREELVKIGIIASGGGSTASVIMSTFKYGRMKGGEVVLLISTKEGAGCIARAKEREIKYIVLEENKKIKDKKERISEWNERLQIEVSRYDINVLISAGGVKQIFPIPGVAIYNTHPASISKVGGHGGRGMFGLKPHMHVLKAIKDEINREVRKVEDDFFTTINFHRVDEGIDTGKPLLQVHVKIPYGIVRGYATGTLHLGAAAKRLQKHVLEYEYLMLPSAVNLAIKDYLDWGKI